MDNSYQDMIDRIKNELQRNDSDIDDIIKHAISDAIMHFKDEVFAVNQSTYNITAYKFGKTGSDAAKWAKDPLYRAYIELPYDFNQMINLMVVKGGTNYVMEELPYVELDAMDAKYDDPTTGTPQYYSFFGEYGGDQGRPSNPAGSRAGSIGDRNSEGSRTDSDRYVLNGLLRIFPRPDNDYTLTMRYVSNLMEPEAMGGNLATRRGFWMNEAGRMIKCYAKGIIYSDYLQQFDLAQAQEGLAEAEYNRLVMRSEARGLTDVVSPHL